MTMERKPKKPVKKKLDKTLHLVLDGKIFIEQRLGKKIVKSSEIDGLLVLQTLLYVIDQGINLLENDK